MSRPIVLLLAILACVSQLAPVSVGAQSTDILTAYIGRWQGTATQVNPTSEWPVTIALAGGEIGAVVGRIDYPSQQCGGDLTVSRVDTDADLVELTEALTYGEGVCADGGTVVLQRQPNGSLLYRWSHPTVDSPASGILTPEGENATPSPTVPRAQVTFRFDADVSAEDEAYVREGVRLAQDFLAATFGLDVTSPVTFEAGAGDPGGRSAASTYGSGRVGIETEHPVWTESGALQRIKIIVHEYFHLLQEDLLKGRQSGPMWLMEGAAEYVAYLAVAERDLISYDAVRDYHFGGAAFNLLLTLEGMESSTGFAEANQSCCAYSLSPLAVEILTASRGITAITDYYSLVGRGEDPGNTFEAAFGVTLEDFYAAFSVERQGFAPLSPTHPRLQLPAPFVDGIADVTITGVTSPLPRGEQGLLTAVTAPGMLCSLTLTSPQGEEVLTVPTHADPAGNAFWLFSTEPDVGEGMATAGVSCGGTPAWVTVELV